MNTIVLIATAPDTGRSWWHLIEEGGVVGWIILGLSAVAVVLCIVHFAQIRRGGLIPNRHVESLKAHLSEGDVAGAIAFARAPEHDSYIVRIVRAGLDRQVRSPFGSFEIRSAMEDGGREETGRLERSLEGLGLVATIAPLLGLLGTVVGMVGAFDSIALTSGTDYARLAGNISLALVTTLMGLSLAIPCVAMHTWFRNRVEAIASEAATVSDHLASLVESGGARGAGGSRASEGGD